MTNINLINEKNSKLDLSSVKDAHGEMIILQPKGAKGSQRECHEDVLEHPHVALFTQAKWLRYEKVSLTPLEVPLDQRTPFQGVAGPGSEGSTSPEETLIVEAPVTDVIEATSEPVDEVLVLETPVVDVVEPTRESMEVGESIGSTMTPGNKRKHRRD